MSAYSKINPSNIMWSREPNAPKDDIVHELPPIARAHIATVQQLHTARDVAGAAGLIDLGIFFDKMANEAIERHQKYLDPNGSDQAHMRKHGLADADGKMIRSN